MSHRFSSTFNVIFSPVYNEYVDGPPLRAIPSPHMFVLYGYFLMHIKNDDHMLIRHCQLMNKLNVPLYRLDLRYSMWLFKYLRQHKSGKSNGEELGVDYFDCMYDAMVSYSVCLEHQLLFLHEIAKPSVSSDVAIGHLIDLVQEEV